MVKDNEFYHIQPNTLISCIVFLIFYYFVILKNYFTALFFVSTFPNPKRYQKISCLKVKLNVKTSKNTISLLCSIDVNSILTNTGNFFEFPVFYVIISIYSFVKWFFHVFPSSFYSAVMSSWVGSALMVII